MIPSALASSASPATPVLVSVQQNAVSAVLVSTWGTSFSPIAGGGTIQVQTSPDNSTWTDRAVTSGGIAPLSTSVANTVVSFIETNTYYRIRQVLFGATSNWSNAVHFTQNLATEPIAPPTSVVITNVTRPFSDRYRVFFTVTQAAAITGFSGLGFRWNTTWASFNQEDITLDSIPSGATAYSVDLLGSVIPDATFQVTVRNRAGGYESTPVSSNIWNEFEPQESTVEFFLNENPITVPSWATNFDYWLVGGGGGGGSGRVVSVGNNENFSEYYVGNSGLGGSVQSGNLSLPIADLNFLIGTGGNGAGRIFNELATAGGSSQLRSGSTPLVTAAGGARGTNDILASFASPPSTGNPSANVTVDSTVFTGMPGAPPAEGGGYPDANTDLMDSIRITGGAGGGYAWPDAGLPDANETVFVGGLGGPGYCKIRFRNF